MKILVTGGAGYIGSMICYALEKKGHSPVILDSFITGKQEFISNNFICYHGDISDKRLVDKIFHEHSDISLTIHCAARIIVPESVKNPFLYYEENVSKSNKFFNYLRSNNCTRIIFSSSASIYALVEGFKCHENSPIDPKSPYARTKYMMEMILKDFCTAYDMNAISLRYFNPIGADPELRSGLHQKNSTHIIGKLLEVAHNKKAFFEITGTDWPTRDGTGIRDYIHVWDLAEAHVKAAEEFENIFENVSSPYQPINIGHGNGITVREFMRAFEKATQLTIPCKELPPRPGDAAGYYSDTSLSKTLLKWSAQKSIENAIKDAMRWHEKYYTRA